MREVGFVVIPAFDPGPDAGPVLVGWSTGTPIYPIIVSVMGQCRTLPRVPVGLRRSYERVAITRLWDSLRLAMYWRM